MFRCREYRDKLKIKRVSHLTEVDSLELENARLRQKHQNMKETLDRAKKYYLDLIVKGCVKFVA